MIPPEMLLAAYAQGFFPMARSRHGRIDWYTTDPRGIINLERFHVPRRLRRFLRQARFDYTFDRGFEAVMRGCADRPETWISEALIASYVRLHALGHAHSVEVWQAGELAGGIYGVHLGAAFFAESMFYRLPGASKAALVQLVQRLQERRFLLLDIQMVTSTTAQFGAEEIPADEYLARLRTALAEERTFG
ncbi:MAG: leucyl/phenylalanyl-tRNA--protein transferase [Armatimonadetes bacterium]|nr:leucyl/phenylalanyl-tRNA--protein transferase [Armatimonadota bacterium]